ncbi:MAG: efflux RND transporter periplasmic adaptor subunit [Chthoniobacterales bacterium]
MKRSHFILLIALLTIGFGGWFLLKSKARKSETEHSGKAEHEHAERQVKLTPEQLANANLKIEDALPATIKTMVAVYGKVAPNEEALARVAPRFPGIVKTVKKRLGDKVEAGEVLAQIESNESLKAYDVKSEIAGTVIQKDVTLGELVKDDKTIFTVANLDTVWIDLSIFRRDFGSLAVGSAVEFHTGEGHVSGQQHIHATVSYISPFGSEGSQTMLARCVVPNKEGVLRPGLYVDGEVVTGEVQAVVTVRNGALQEMEGKTVIFVAEGEAFETREVRVGVRDTERSEITSGLRPGERYVADNSFMIKAELGKSETEHEH